MSTHVSVEIGLDTNVEGLADSLGCKVGVETVGETRKVVVFGEFTEAEITDAIAALPEPPPPPLSPIEELQAQIDDLIDMMLGG